MPWCPLSARKKKPAPRPTVAIELIPPNATPEEREQADEEIAAMLARIFLGIDSGNHLE